MTYAFLIAFASLGLYFVWAGIWLRIRLTPDSEDYKEIKKKSTGYICGGLLFIIIALCKFYTRIVLWGWT